MPNAALVEALRRRAAELPGLTLIDASVEQVVVGADGVELQLGDGYTIAAKLIVGADGRQSLCRQAAEISVRTWVYEQSAVTCTFVHQRHARGHLDRVPPPGRPLHGRAVARPRLEPRLGGAPRDCATRSPRSTTPPSAPRSRSGCTGCSARSATSGRAASFRCPGYPPRWPGRNRIALVGEAVHVIPPIGAQGLNLGLRDAACIADCVADALAAGGDIGAPPVLEAYGRMRRTDIASRIWTIDLLNRSLLSRAPPVQALRGLGLHILKNVGPLRRLAIREGLAPSFIAPRLMQPAAAGSGHRGLDAARLASA